MSDLPAYTPAEASRPLPMKSSMAGPIQTCSIEDGQHDYYRVTRDSTSSYQLSLTVDATPLYRVEVVHNPSANADIQLFTAFSASPANAACRITPKPPKGSKGSKGAQGLPDATLCTSLPLSASAKWRPLNKTSGGSSSTRHHYAGSLPLVMVPGCPPVLRMFSWKLGQSRTEPDVELWLKEELPYPSNDCIDRRQLFARYYGRNTRLYEKGVLEVRRGGGLEFEFGVVVGLLAVLQLSERKCESYTEYIHIGM